MKRTGTFLFSCMLGLLLTGCGDTQAETLLVEEASPTHNIRILYDMEQVLQRQEASVYTAKDYCPKEELVYDTLIQGEAVAEDDAFGKAYYVQGEDTCIEYLHVYEKGADAGKYGGFAYGMNQKQRQSGYFEVIDAFGDHPAVEDQMEGTRMKSS